MGTPVQHASIPDANRHEPKGASSAANGHALFSNGDTTTSFRAIDWVDIGGTPTFSLALTEVLDASNYTDQTTTTKDTPVQISFGAATSSDDIDLDAAGTVTFLTAGTYTVFIELYVSKLGGSSSTRMFFREQYDGVMLGHASVIRFRGSEVDGIRQVQFSTVIEATAGKEYKIYFATDTTNTTGLVSETLPTITGWTHTDTASAHIHAYKFGG